MFHGKGNYILEIKCCGIILLYTVKICHSNWFNKTLPGRKYRQGNQTTYDGKTGRVWNHQSDTEGTGDEYAMLIKELPHGRV